MIHRTKLYVQPRHIVEVFAALIAEEPTEIEVADDRGGSGHWNITAEEGPEQWNRKRMRKVYNKFKHCVQIEVENL